METHAIVRKAVAGCAAAPLPESDDESLFDTGTIDSFGLMNLVAELEKEFGVKVPDAELSPRRFETVNKIVTYFDSRRS